MRIKNLLIAGLLLLPLLFGAGCKKEVAFDSLLILKGWTQEQSGGDLKPLHEVVIYGFRADTTAYAPASYEDALAGRLTAKSDPSIQIEAEFRGSAHDLAGFGITQAMQVSDLGSLYLLVVNPTDQLYAYTMQQMAENLPNMYISFTFKLWNVGRVKKEGAWMVYNDFYVPDITRIVRTYQQMDEGGEPTTLKNSKIFAYAVDDPEQWLPTDYTSAETGRLTNSATGEVVDFDYSFTSDSQGVFSLAFPPRNYLLMLFNATLHSCALYPFTESDGELNVTLAPWHTDYPYTDEQGWLHLYFPGTLQAYEQSGVNTTPTPLTTPSTLFLYSVSGAKQWQPANLEAAVAGRLTHTETGEEAEPIVRIEADAEGRFLLEVPMHNYLMMFLHAESRTCALLDFEPEDLSSDFSITVAWWKQEYPYNDQNGWMHLLLEPADSNPDDSDGANTDSDAGDEQSPSNENPARK